jgi:hypothetical protein
MEEESIAEEKSIEKEHPGAEGFGGLINAFTTASLK